MKKFSLKSGWLIVLISCLLITSCKKAPQRRMGAKSFEVITLTQTNQLLNKTYSAAIKGRQDINILPQVSGFITKVCVKEGESVKKGQSLFIIDQTPYKANVQAAEANVEIAKATAATAELTYESKITLFSKKVISSFDLQTAKNTFLTAKAQLSAAKAQLVIAQNNLNYSNVTSPTNGIVGKIPFRVGTLVGPSLPKPLTTISDNSEMYVYFSMTEKNMLQLVRQYGSIDSALSKMPPIQLELSDGSLFPIKGTIESISGVIDPATGSVSFRAVFPNTNRLLLSGGSGRIIYPVMYNNMIVIPQTAAYSIQEKIFVYKVVDGKAVATEIHVSPINNGKEYIVESGIQKGDVIVKNGVGMLRDGMPVKLKGQKAPQQKSQQK